VPYLLEVSENGLANLASRTTGCGLKALAVRRGLTPGSGHLDHRQEVNVSIDLERVLKCASVGGMTSQAHEQLERNLQAGFWGRCHDTFQPG
jgi:hypothetical protein